MNNTAREKRAFGDESIQDTLPSETLDLTQRSAIDLSSTIAAQGAKPGIYTDPEIYNELAKISMDVHKTRRNSRDADFDVKLTDYRYAKEEELYMDQLTRQMELDTQFLRSANVFSAYVADNFSKAEKGQFSFKDAMNLAKDEAYTKLDEYAKVSPYLHEKFNSFAGTFLKEKQQTAIQKDYDQAENKRNLEIEAAKSQSFYEVTTGSIVDDVEHMSSFITTKMMPGSNNIEEVKDQEAANVYVNQYALVKAKQIQALVEAGDLSVQQGKEAITTLIADAHSFEVTGKINNVNPDIISDPDTLIEQTNSGEFGSKEATWKVGLTATTINSLLETRRSLKSDQAKIDTTYIKEGFMNKVDASKVKPGNGNLNILDSTFYRYGSLSQLESDFNYTEQALLSAVANDNKAALGHLIDVRRQYYSVSLPIMAGKELAVFTGGDMGQIQNAITGLSMIDWNNPRADYSFLRLNINGKTVDLNYNHEKQKEPGVDPGTSATNHLKALNTTLKELMDFSRKEGGSAFLLAANQQIEKVNISFANTLTDLLYTDPKTGTIAVNQNKLVDMQAHFRAQKTAANTFGGNSIIVARQNMQSINKIAQNYDMKQREMLYFGVGSSAFENPEMLMGYVYADLNDTEKQGATRIGEYTLLSTTVGGNIEAEKIRDYRLTGKNTTLEQLDSKSRGILTGNKGKNTASKYLAYIMDEKNIAPEHRPLVRALFTDMVAAHIELNPDEKFDCKRFETVLDANYEGGIYKHGTIYRSGNTFQTPGETIEFSKKATNTIKSHMGGLTSGQDVSATINQTNANMLIKVGDRFVTTEGITSKATFDTKIEIGLEAPEGVDKNKYREGAVRTGAVAAAVATVAGLRTNPDIRKKAELINRDISIDQWEEDTALFLSSVADQENQKRVITALCNRGKGLNITQHAPEHLVDLVFIGYIEGLTGPFRYDSARVAGITAGTAADIAMTSNPILNFALDKDTKGKIRTGIADTVQNAHLKITSSVTDFIDDLPMSDNKVVNWITGQTQSIWAEKTFLGTNTLEDLKKQYKDEYDELKLVMDMYHTLAVSPNKSSLDVPPEMIAEVKGENTPFIAVESLLSNTSGFYVTSTTTGKHAPGTRSHGEGWKADIGFRGGFDKIKDWDTGLPSIEKMDELLDSLKPLIDAGLITRINTGYTELVHDSRVDVKHGYSKGVRKEYAKYRNMKNAKGEPLFGHLNAHNAQGSAHLDHFDVEFSRQVYDKKTGKSLGVPLDIFAKNATANAVANINNKPGYGKINPGIAGGLAYAFYNYKVTEQDAARMGADIKVLKDNPYYGHLAVCRKFMDLQDAFGNGATNLPIMAIAGAKFRFVPADSNLSPADNLTAEDILKYHSKRMKGKFILMPGETKSKYNKVINTVAGNGGQ